MMKKSDLGMILPSGLGGGLTAQLRNDGLIWLIGPDGQEVSVTRKQYQGLERYSRKIENVAKRLLGGN